MNHLGLPLRVDGDAGPETRWALAAALLQIERQLAIRRAQRHLGLVEASPNVDREGIIASYLLECGVKVPSAWCAAALSCWLAVPGIRIAGAQAIGRAFPAVKDPVAGDVFWYPTGEWEGHCGLVTGVGALDVMTIEGNSDNGQRCWRRLKAGLNFSRPFPLGNDPGPETILRVPLKARGLTRWGPAKST